MPTASAAGAALGVAVQVYANAIRKLPALHQPWLHVAWALGGASAATALVEWTDKASAEVEADVARRAAAVRAAGRG